MNTSRLTFMAVCLFGMAAATIQIGDAATNFNGSTVLGVDHTEQTVTFRTKEGEKWTLPVDNPDLLKNNRIAQGDQVSIELDPNDRITKIIKPNDASGSPRAESHDEGGQ